VCEEAEVEGGRRSGRRKREQKVEETERVVEEELERGQEKEKVLQVGDH